MITLRKGSDRGHFDHGWFETYHTFSFGQYYDPAHMGFRALRVINEDWFQPGRGFGSHPHEDMEIITYVIEGGLAHRDSLGTGSVIGPGELQRMTAGTGITHSEFNDSRAQPVHLYQIWLVPDREGLEPSYEQKAFPETERHNRLRLVVSPEGEDGALKIHQDARLFLASLDEEREVTHSLGKGRHAWVQALRGKVRIHGIQLEAGDAVAVSDEPAVAIEALEPSEAMVFDLA
jgi:quercetin 2,3-dioxygenase